MVDASRLHLALLLATLLYLAAGLCLLQLLGQLIFRRLRRHKALPAAATEGAAPTARRWLVRLARGLQAAVLALAGLGLLALGWARFVEPDWIAVERVRLELPRLPAGAPTLRLVLLSDLHCEAAARLEPRLPELVAGLQPDLILFVGDALNEPAGLANFRALMTRLAGVAPTYAVRGNWDVWFFQDLELYDGTGVQVLDGEAATLRLKGVELRLVGAAVENEHRLPALLAAPADGAKPLTILLHHYPEMAADGLARGADLALAGDTHGGQVRLPFLGALVRLSRRGRYYDIGLQRPGGDGAPGRGCGWLYVSRGLGLEGGGGAPRLRFLCRPEVTLLELVPAAP